MVSSMMRKTIMGLLSIAAGMWIGWVMFFGAAGTYVTHNPEGLVDEKAIQAQIEAGDYGEFMQHQYVETKRIGEKADALKCEQSRSRYSVAWDKSVENGTLDRDADRLARLKAREQAYCR